MMRTDLQQSLNRSHIEPSALSIFQRILLTTDGTVTDILEAYLLEKIQAIKLHEVLIPLAQDMPLMELKAGTEVIEREILLRGKISRKNFIYAKSIIVPERLEEDFKNELLKTRTPIGQIWLEKKLETFKEIVDSGREPANDLSIHFQIEPEMNLFFRTYRVFSNHQLTMMITEKFPESYFRKAL